MSITGTQPVGGRSSVGIDVDLGRRIEEALRAAGHRAVVVGGSRSISGVELERTTRVMARRLMDGGAGRGGVVSIRQDDRTDVIVSVIATLRAGAAFCVVPRSYPEERVAMIHDAISPVQVLEEPLGVEEHLGDTAATEPDGGYLPVREPGDLAYVIFTSGTTGVPKAVQIADRGVHYIADRPELYHGGVIGQLAAMQFDASVYEILGGLLNGLTVRLLDVEGLVSPDGDELLASVDTLFLTTQLFNLLSTRSPDALASVGLVLFGGERASAPHVRAFAGRTSLLHVYGPTETTVFATAWPVRGVFDDNVPIGHAIDGATVLVVDDAGDPVVDGEGELLVGGAGLMLGYRDNATAVDPVTEASGVRYYRTGDRVARRSDGLLTHLGRRDRQVKVSGFRVDLAEVEAAAARIEGVEQAVAAHVDGQLRAYYTGMPSSAEVRDGLRAVLPRYSVPVVERVSRIPLTPNGKTDLGALAAEAVRTAGADLVLRTVREVLQVEVAPDSATFVELGGDSIAAMDVVWQLDKAGVRVDVLDLLTLPLGTVCRAR